LSVVRRLSNPYQLRHPERLSGREGSGAHRLLACAAAHALHARCFASSAWRQEWRQSSQL